MSRLIEFSGTPDAGKTTLINSVCEHLRSSGINVIHLGEANGEELPPQNLRGSLDYNKWVGINACNGIMQALSQNPDLIIADRGFLDFRFWNYFYQSTGKATPQEVQNLQNETFFQNRDLVPDLFVAITVSLEEALKRNPNLEKKQDWVIEHNSLFESFYESYNGPKFKMDTSGLSKENVLNKSLELIFKTFPEFRTNHSEKSSYSDFEL